MEEYLKMLKNMEFDEYEWYINNENSSREENFIKVQETMPKIIKSIENLIKENKDMRDILKCYNTISGGTMPDNMKIVIADRYYFCHGILDQTLIEKRKIIEK